MRIKQNEFLKHMCRCPEMATPNFYVRMYIIMATVYYTYWSIELTWKFLCIGGTLWLKIIALHWIS